MRIATVVIGVALAGCGSHKEGGAGSNATTPGSGGSEHAAPGSGSASAAPAMTPEAAEAKAREILQHQIDASKAHDKSIQQTFAQDAVVAINDAATTADVVTAFGLADPGPEGFPVDKATITKVVAGGNADAVWFYGEVEVDFTDPGAGKQTETTRVVEVASAAEHWKVVAASFGKAHELQGSGGNREVQNATGSDGPLAKLLGSPSTVAAQLAPEAIVVGPQSVAHGAGAKDALVGWKLEPISLFKRAREIRTATWGFAQASLDHPDGKYTDRLSGMVVATATPDGKWSVVLAAYVGQ